MKPVLKTYRYRGINDRISDRNIPDTSLVECKNWEIDDVLGDLVVSKGFAQRFDDNLGGDVKGLKEYVVTRDSGKKILITKKNNTTLSYWRFDEVSEDPTENIIDLTTIGTEVDEVDFQETSGVCYGGVGNDSVNIPFWFGYTKRDRFNVSGTYQEILNGYYLDKEECLPLSVGTSYGSSDIVYGGAADDNQDFGIDDFDTGTYYLKFTAVYDGFQEVPIQQTDQQQITIGATVDQAYFTVSVKKNISKRITAINVWMAKQSDASTFGYGTGYGIVNFGNQSGSAYKLVKTLYTDSTPYFKRTSATLSTLIESNFLWREDTSNSSYWQAYPGEDTTNDERLHVNFSEYSNGISYTDSLQYPHTTRVMPNYKYSKELKGTRYVADALYKKNSLYNTDSYLPDVVYFSPPDKPNIIPETNHIKFTETVTGLGKTNSYLLIYGENSLAIYDKDQFYVDDYSKDGCVSHDSISEHNGTVYWAGKFGINKFDRFYPKDITSFKIRQLYKNIPLESLRKSSGCMDLANREYILSIPDENLIIKYNIDTEEFTTKTGRLVSVSEGVDNDVVAISHGDSKYVMTYNSGYSQDGTYYTATATTKVLSGENAENIIKSLLLGYCNYKSDDTLTIQVLVDGAVKSTISLDAQSTMKPTQFAIQDSSGYGLGNENYQLKIKLTTSASTTKGQVGFIKLFGEVHDIQGG